MVTGAGNCHEFKTSLSYRMRDPKTKKRKRTITNKQKKNPTCLRVVGEWTGSINKVLGFCSTRERKATQEVLCAKMKTLQVQN